MNKIPYNLATLSINPSDLNRQSVLSQYRRHVNSGFAKLAEVLGIPVEAYSNGCLVYDETGEPYLDCGGYGVFILGHRHPRIVEAVEAQLIQHPLATRSFLNAPLAAASESLANACPPGLEYVFFTNSGAEAVEVGIKLARLNGKHKIIAMEGGFHGKTMGALSVTSRFFYRKPFLPLLEETQFIPYGEADALKKALEKEGEQKAVILEPVLGEGGVIIPPPMYLKEVENLCRQYGAFLILDEIQTGLGRLGSWWGRDIEKITPDVMLVGKGLSGGIMPVGATIATAEAFQILNKEPLLHSSTFAGNPLAMAAAHAAIQTIEQEKIVDKSYYLGKRILSTIQTIMQDACPELVFEVRGIGLLIGLEFKAEHFAGDFLLKLLEKKVVVSTSLNTNKVVRLTPPAILNEPELEWLFDAIRYAAIELKKTWLKR